MSLRSLMRVHEDVLRQGWALTTATEMGLDTAATREALAPSLAPDPRGAGKLHARDVVTYEGAGASLAVAEAASIAHGDTDDFSRCLLTGPALGDLVPRTVLRMVPASLRRPGGRMSADYFRYAPGAESRAHQDRFGDMVTIWVLAREGDGGESFLSALDGRGEVFRRVIMPGELVIFRDELFLHGVTAMSGDDAFRDALIFITLKDGA
jgi:2OG-Fe dioxygenase